MRKLSVVACLLLLVGCGGRAPMHRAREVLFDVPYIQQEQTYDTLTLGLKRLSELEIDELFCKAEQIKKLYYVYYIRTGNTGENSYFVHLASQSLPTHKDVSIFFDPHTTLHTVAHVLFMIPAGIGLMMLAPDPLTSFAGFLGLNIGMHLAESQALGLPGYSEFEKHVISGGSQHRMTSLIAVPKVTEHHLIFVPQQDPHALRLVFTVSARNTLTKELTFDFSDMEMVA